MKKVLFVCDGNHFSKGVYNCAVFLNSKEDILLTGIFLPAIDYSRLAAYAYGSIDEGAFMVPDFYNSEEETISKNAEKFAELCRKNNIPYHIHKDTAFTTLQELKEETRFADLALISSELFFATMSEVQPNASLKEVLHATECPVLLVPEKFTVPDNILLTYDGKATSVDAIRQFSQVMPFFSYLPVSLVYLATGAGNALPSEDAIREYLSAHFSDLTITVLDERTQTLNDWISRFPNPLLVAGAYARSWVSQFFKKSFVEESIKRQLFPIFLYHSH